MSDLKDKHIVVVGGSSGIGLAVAELSLASGARVTVMGRSPDRLDAAVAGTLKGFDRVSSVPLDITNETAVHNAFADLDTPDHVYVAAASFVGGSVTGSDMASLRSALEARLWGSVHVVRAVATRMTGPDASFVFTGGVSTDRPAKGAWPTAVGTAAAEQLARCLALELAPLRFNAISPGWTDTPMWDGVLGEAKAQTFAGVGGQIPTGRLATAAQAASAVLLLMSNAAINGEVLHVDGGHRLV